MKLLDGIKKIDNYVERITLEARQQEAERRENIENLKEEIFNLHGERIVTLIRLAQYCMKNEVDVSNYLVSLGEKIGFSTTRREYLGSEDLIDSIGMNGRGCHFRVFLDGERISFIGIKEKEYPNEGRMARFEDYETFVQDLEKFKNEFSKFADLFEDYIENL